MQTNYYIAMYNPKWAGPVAYPVNGTGEDFFNGRQLSSVNPKSSYVLRVDRQCKTLQDFPPADYFTCSDMTVFFSDKLIKCLNDEDVDNIEYYDVDVLNEFTGEKYLCKAANVIGIINAIDTVNSEYETICGDIISSVSKLVFNEKAFHGIKIFRFFEFTTLLIVSSDLKEAIEKAGITGMLFISPEDWDDSML